MHSAQNWLMLGNDLITRLQTPNNTT